MRGLITLLLFAVLSVDTACAQPSPGVVLSDTIALGSGRSVPLPPGNWELLAVKQYHGERAVPLNSTAWTAYFLRNSTPDSLTEQIIIRIGYHQRGWNESVCILPKETILNNLHGTAPNLTTNKCSGIFKFEKKGLIDTYSKYYDYEIDLENLADKSKGDVVVATSQIFSGKYAIDTKYYMRLPKSISATALFGEYSSAPDKRRYVTLDNWLTSTTRKIEQSYFEKRPQQFAFLYLSPEQEFVLADSSANSPQLSSDREKLIDDLTAKQQERSAQEAKFKEQERLAQEAKAKEQERLAHEANSKEQARLAQEARAQEQERFAQEASTREQARLAQEARAREERIAAQQLDTEIQKLKQQLALLEARGKSANAPVEMPQRKALVIGNDSYSHVPKLLNAREDAKAIAESLKPFGYEVSLRLDLQEKEMKKVLRDFKSQVSAGDEVLVFYAGHGVQIGATNYLLPIDISGESEDQIRDDAIELQRVLDDMHEKKAKFTLAMFDACRDNPFKTSGRAIGGRGLAPTTTATGQMVVFSAGAGQQALDKLSAQDHNKNGLFTRVFLSEVQKSGLSVDRIIRNVRSEVVSLARSVGREQVPAIYDQVIGEFYFMK